MLNESCLILTCLIQTCNFLIYFLAFDFCQFYMIIRFFILPQRPMTSDFEGILSQILSVMKKIVHVIILAFIVKNESISRISY